MGWVGSHNELLGSVDSKGALEVLDTAERLERDR